MNRVDRENDGWTASQSTPAGHLLIAQERYLQKIARALHDGPVQEIIAAQFLLAAMAGDEATRTALQTTLQDVTEGLRALCQTLYPPALGPFGLFKAIESLVEGVSSSAPGLSVTLHQTGDDQSLPAWGQQQLFRIVQELLTNAVTHAKAQHVQVVLAIMDDRVELSVTDDGIGLPAEVDATALDQFVQQGQFGLNLTTIRAQLLGGQAAIGPGPAGGTRAMLTIVQPLPDSPIRL